ncbi:MAG: hypothetical protein HFJ32_03115 [Clostridia bacterium]|nr:hypothetical protein [Clostridia bacterium]
MYTVGDNGILKAAKEAKNQTEAAIRNEQQSLGELANMLKNEYGGDDNNQGGNTENPDPDKPVVDVPIEEIKTNWEEIEKIAGEIAKDDSITSDLEEATVTVDGNRYTIKPGDLFEVEYEGEVRRVRVLGFKHDDLVDQTVYGGNHTKASISFEFYDCLGTHNMNGTSSSNSTNANGWAATEMRTFLEGSSGRGQLSNNSYIKQVKKKYIATYNNASSVTTSNDYLWLLSASEVLKDGYNGGDTRGYAIAKEGEQYLYYQKNVTEAWNWNSSNTNRVKYNNGSASYWWLRSPSNYGSTGFCLVRTGGNSSGDLSHYYWGVAPGFCI